MFKFFLIAACVATAMATSIPYELCPTPEGTAGTLPGPVSFAIPQCSGLPCSIAVGQPVTLLIGIYVDGPVNSLPTKAFLTVGDHDEFEYALPTGDACSAIPTGCPQAAGNYLITFDTALQGVNPGTDAIVRVKINNDAGRVIACGIVSTTFA